MYFFIKVFFIWKKKFKREKKRIFLYCVSIFQLISKKTLTNVTCKLQKYVRSTVFGEWFTCLVFVITVLLCTSGSFFKFSLFNVHKSFYIVVICITSNINSYNFNLTSLYVLLKKLPMQTKNILKWIY